MSLWYDERNNLSVSEKIEDAIAHYAKKGIRFTKCYLHKDVNLKVDSHGLILKHSQYVLPNHFLFEGQENEAIQS